MQAAMITAHFAVDAACFAPLVIHHRQLSRWGMCGGPLGGGPSRLSDDGGIRISQEWLGEIGLLQHLTTLIYSSGPIMQAE